MVSFNIEIIVSAGLNLSPSPLLACDDDNDGFFNNFILTDKIDEITSGNPNIEISFHPTELDALNNMNPLVRLTLMLLKIHKLYI